MYYNEITMYSKYRHHSRVKNYHVWDVIVLKRTFIVTHSSILDCTKEDQLRCKLRACNVYGLFYRDFKNSNSTASNEELSVDPNLLAVIPLFSLNSMLRFVVGSWSSEQVISLR